MRFLLAFLLFSFAVMDVRGQKEERILSFVVEIAVETSGDLVVTERIRVSSTGREIQRGIYRELPDQYRNSLGLMIRPPLQVEDVMRDGKPEAWHQERKPGTLRVYFGDKDRILRPGVYEYLFRYRTSEQLFHHEDSDELYWNVTGNAWSFPIDLVEVTVNLPPGAEIQNTEAWTGPAGAQGKAWEISNQSASSVTMVSTEPLGPGEGLTIAVHWNPGIVTVFSGDAFSSLVAANSWLILSAFLVFGGVLYLLIMWLLVGRGPARGVIFPQYSPPDWMDPTCARFLRRNGKIDNISFASAIVHLAVGGFLSIHPKEKNSFTLQRTGKPLEEAPEPEAAMAEKLFGTGDTIDLTPANRAIIQEARKALGKTVQALMVGPLFKYQRGVWAVGLALILPGLALAISQSVEPVVAIFMSVWLSGWSFGTGALLSQFFDAAKRKAWLPAVGLGLFSLPFMAGWVFGFVMLMWACSIFVGVIVGIGALSSILFYLCMRAPTEEGRKALDALEGFRYYLNVGERDRLNLENPPTETPELFERFLPYALALDVEQAWSNRFASTLQEASWSPHWGPGINLTRGTSFTGMSAFTQSLSSCVSSASSSSSSGGGSSGGGRGGGGGGGW